MFGIKRQLDRIEALLAPKASTISLVESAVQMERDIGIPGVLSFLGISPAVFARPESTGRGRSYSEEHFSRMLAAPGFAGLLREVQGHATADTALILLVTRWPDWHKDWKNVGLNFDHGPGVDTAIVLMSDYGTRTNLVPRSYQLHSLRGSFGYDGDHGVFVLATPADAMAGLFREGFDAPLVKNEARIAPECVVGLTDAPTERELQLIEQMLRAYWKRLADEFGYRAQREESSPLSSLFFPERKLGQDPAVDDLPEVLALPAKVAGPGLPREVGLKDSYGAQGFLESWHRLNKVARIVRGYRPKAAPADIAATA